MSHPQLCQSLKLTRSSHQEHLRMVENILHEVVSLAGPLRELCARIDGGIDVPPQRLLDRRRMFDHVSERHLTHHHQVDVASGPEPRFARRGAITERKATPCP